MAATLRSVSARRLTRAMLVAKVGIGGERGIVRELSPPAPAIRDRSGRDENIDAVAGREHAVRRDGGVCETDALRRLAALPAASAAPPSSRPWRQTSRPKARRLRRCAARAIKASRIDFVGIHAGSDIDDRNADARRLRRAGDRGEAGLPLGSADRKLCAWHRARSRRSRKSSSRSAADNSRRNRAIGKPSLPIAPGLQILHENIGALEHGFEQRLVIGLW